MDLNITYAPGPDGEKVMSIPDDIRADVLAFISEHAKKSAAGIEAIVSEGQAELLAALDGVSEAQAAFKPDADSWSILDLIAHEVSVRRTIGTLCASLRNGALPPGFGPQFEEAKAQDGFILQRFDSLADARAAAESTFESMVAYVRSLDDAVSTDVTFRHYYFGPFNARQWPLFLRIHDGDHTLHIAKIKSATGYPAA